MTSYFTYDGLFVWYDDEKVVFMISYRLHLLIYAATIAFQFISCDSIFISPIAIRWLKYFVLPFLQLDDSPVILKGDPTTNVNRGNLVTHDEL